MRSLFPTKCYTCSVLLSFFIMEKRKYIQALIRRQHPSPGHRLNPCESVVHLVRGPASAAPARSVTQRRLCVVLWLSGRCQRCSLGLLDLLLFRSSVFSDPLPDCPVHYWKWVLTSLLLLYYLFLLFCQLLCSIFWGSAVRCVYLMICCVDGLALFSL